MDVVKVVVVEDVAVEVPRTVTVTLVEQLTRKILQQHQGSCQELTPSKQQREASCRRMGS